MAGEGRGHAARVRALAEELRGEHQLVLLAPDQAHDFLASSFPPGSYGIELRRIPGLRFHYTRGRLDLTKTMLHAAAYRARLPRLVGELREIIRGWRPDLAIVDFEPALPRAARDCRVPVVSLNHQGFLVECRLRSLPASLRAYGYSMRPVIELYHWWQVSTIVSSFFKLPLRPRGRRVMLVGPMLRPEVRHASVTAGDHLLSYLRAETPERVLDVLSRSDREVRIYGLGLRRPYGPLRFKELSEPEFLADLASCAAVVGAAGNQTLGEALHLGKPILALPEERHHEQLINAHLLERMGAGRAVTLESFSPGDLYDFLADLESFGRAAERHRGQLDGTAAARAEIEHHLKPSARPTSG